MRKLSADFFQREDTLTIARELLGKVLISNINDQLTGGIIVETEAYQGPLDRGSHAYGGKRTARNEMMYNRGGLVYMYICYGIHDMINVVTGSNDSSHAILIRALQPTLGLEVMRERRNIYNQDKRLCQGPGALSKAMGLNKSHNGIDLQHDLIWIEDQNINFSNDEILETARVGMNFDGPYKTIPWRFLVKDNKYVSKPHY
ncbi:MAG: DNA-3-methyladenine glycosylase [Daejeonella sp.]